MTLIDDTCDGCGGRFDPMGDPLLQRHPEISQWAVYCGSCEQKSRHDTRTAWQPTERNEDDFADVLIDRRGQHPHGLAQAILASPALRGLLADAWDEGHQTPQQYGCGCFNANLITPNPYREEQS